RALQGAERRSVAEDAAPVALVEVATTAEEALAAGGEEGAQHAVSLAHARHIVARGDHRAHVLVAERKPGLDLDPPVVEVQVRTADSCRLDPHHRIVWRPDLRVRLLLHPDLAGRLVGDGAHRGAPYVSR